MRQNAAKNHFDTFQGVFLTSWLLRKGRGVAAQRGFGGGGVPPSAAASPLACLLRGVFIAGRPPFAVRKTFPLQSEVAARGAFPSSGDTKAGQ